MRLLNKIKEKFIPSRNSKLLKEFNLEVQSIRSSEKKLELLSTEELSDKFNSFKKYNKDLDSLKKHRADIFAICSEMASRTLGMRPFDVQLIAGLSITDGMIPEMGTGEGKTLMAIIPAAFFSLMEESVHIVTVNDYLAERDELIMRPFFSALGISSCSILDKTDHEDKKDLYLSGIAYITNSVLGFDYLRDNMVNAEEHKVLNGLSFAIIDEIDSILIDEARTPLIISGPQESKEELFLSFKDIVSSFNEQTEHKDGKETIIDNEGHFTLDLKSKNADLTDLGYESLESELIKLGILDKDESLYHPNNLFLVKIAQSTVIAHFLFNKEQDYLVSEDGEIIIIDSLTGRSMPGRRWSGGIHQAVEAFEEVTINPENQTMASITYQNFFRLYSLLSGMTGTAETEAGELFEVYKLEVVVIPPNMPSLRIDNNDQVFTSIESKNIAILNKIKSTHEKGQPLLIGTNSVESSEDYSKLLTENNIKHSVLNAKNHKKEADIIANSGSVGAITIATNMAGRGTDIVLGGSKDLFDNASDWQVEHNKVVATGGLFVLGTERNDSRRVDNQLRGRTGRQGNEGESCFFLSIEDSLFIRFGENAFSFIKKLNIEEGDAIEHPMITRSIENTQRKVEGHFYDSRKQLLKFDDEENYQRTNAYSLRNKLLSLENPISYYQTKRDAHISELVDSYLIKELSESEWDINGLHDTLKTHYGIDINMSILFPNENPLEIDEIKEKILSVLQYVFDFRKDIVSEEVISSYVNQLAIIAFDQLWKENLHNIDLLKENIHLRAMAQKDPLQEFKKESFELFENFLNSFQEEFIRGVSKLNIQPEDNPDYVEENTLDVGESNETNSELLAPENSVDNK